MKTATALLAAAATPAVVLAAETKAKCRPYVTSESLQELVRLEDLLAGSQTLQDIADANGGNRAFGGGGHNATVDWLYDTLSATGYFDVVKQPFVELFSAGSATLSGAGGTKQYTADILTYTAGTGGQTLSRPVVAVANLGCDAADYPAGDAIKDNIALVQRGTCDFSTKASLAKAAGAAAAIVYNNVPGDVSGTLGKQSDANAPIVGIPQDEGAAILAALASGPVVLDLSIESIIENRTNYNVIAETKLGDKDNVLVLGGHSDSVYAGPGINDDGSGTVGVWAVAKALAGFRVKNAVRFAFWGAEEYGKLGSFYYVKQLNKTEAEIAKIRAYLNFDMIASPNYVYGIYDGDGSAFNFSGPAGSDQIERDFEDFFKANNLPSVPSVFSGRSDYAGFIENGIPSGGLFTGAEVLKTAEEAALPAPPYDANYHQAGDTVANLDHDAYLFNTKAIANSVAKYAMSWSSLPAVHLPQRRWSADRHRALNNARSVPGHGHAHAHSGPCGGGSLI
ncbi:Zn-dependent exopeptidase [Apiospora kogelbergensis]|uniref:Zn-dependent exopeptidase n=1 Tax=Apiospora kogelbergensis TaxID=1337665 RepID=UPI00312F0342